MTYSPGLTGVIRKPETFFNGLKNKKYSGFVLNTYYRPEHLAPWKTAVKCLVKLFQIYSFIKVTNQ